MRNAELIRNYELGIRNGGGRGAPRNTPFPNKVREERAQICGVVLLHGEIAYGGEIRLRHVMDRVVPKTNYKKRNRERHSVENLKNARKRRFSMAWEERTALFPLYGLDPQRLAPRIILASSCCHDVLRQIFLLFA